MEITNEKLLISTMGGLWGTITPNVRKVSVEFVENTIIVHFYYEKKPTEQEIELSEDAVTEVIADFSEPILIKCQRQVVEMPKQIKSIGFLVYSRYE